MSCQGCQYWWNCVDDYRDSQGFLRSSFGNNIFHSHQTTEHLQTVRYSVFRVVKRSLPWNHRLSNSCPLQPPILSAVCQYVKCCNGPSNTSGNNFVEAVSFHYLLPSVPSLPSFGNGNDTDMYMRLTRPLGSLSRSIGGAAISVSDASCYQRQ